MIEVSQPINLFPLSDTATSHTLIAGGIGITPTLAMTYELMRRGGTFSLHYCARRPEAAAFTEALTDILDSDRLQLVYSNGDPMRRLDVRALLSTRSEGQHVYVCGPTGLIQAARSATAHWPSDSVHFESFDAGPPRGSPAIDDSPFEVELARSGLVYTVDENASMLDVLEKEGHQPSSLCRQGYCGSCLVEIKDGLPDHRDTILTDEERAENRLVALCCSRAKSRRLVLDL